MGDRKAGWGQSGFYPIGVFYLLKKIPWWKKEEKIGLDIQKKQKFRQPIWKSYVYPFDNDLLIYKKYVDFEVESYEVYIMYIYKNKLYICTSIYIFFILCKVKKK